MPGAGPPPTTMPKVVTSALPCSIRSPRRAAGWYGPWRPCFARTRRAGTRIPGPRLRAPCAGACVRARSPPVPGPAGRRRSESPFGAGREKMNRPVRGRKYALVMVGLPARGKSYTARKLCGYLSWLGYPARVFNVGERRRATLGAGASHEFFDPDNADARRQREELGLTALHEMLDWLREGGRVGIYDATNSTRERRARVRGACAAAGVEVLHIELVTDDPIVIEQNIREVKLDSPDYAGVATAEALADFRRRIAHYQRGYEPVAEDEGPFIRVVDRGRQVLLSSIDGYLVGRIVFFLSNLQLTRRPIWLTRHGQS
ncbi:MAG TPA: hypothetical protein ENO23_09425, partial [Alphaproteobacteria bacterium]|nr:hypothetical protein [Alphaproteobacteria bacterium]